MYVKAEVEDVFTLMLSNFYKVRTEFLCYDASA